MTLDGKASPPARGGVPLEARQRSGSDKKSFLELPQAMRSPLLKRLIDLIGAAILLALSAPLMLGIALLVRFALGRPVLFCQARAGHLGKPFKLVKFRTMREAFGPDGQPLPDEQRLTGLGRFLRNTSLDELPQLFNVLRGDISLVGPRALLTRYSSRYSPEQARRLHVKPGLTGWAQVNGRNALSWEEKFKLDCWYVDHRSAWLDAWILLQTASKVLRAEGVRHAGDASMPEFMGSAGHDHSEPPAAAAKPHRRRGRVRGQAVTPDC